MTRLRPIYPALAIATLLAGCVGAADDQRAVEDENLPALVWVSPSPDEQSVEAGDVVRIGEGNEFHP